MIIMKKNLQLMYNSSSILSALFIILASLSLAGCQDHQANPKMSVPADGTSIKDDMENGIEKGNEMPGWKEYTKPPME